MIQLTSAVLYGCSVWLLCVVFCVGDSGIAFKWFKRTGGWWPLASGGGDQIIVYRENSVGRTHTTATSNLFWPHLHIAYRELVIWSSVN